MVRKRYANTKARARLRRRRPKSPAPKNGWLLAKLAELTGAPLEQWLRSGPLAPKAAQALGLEIALLNAS
jgi:hypothetical protein